MVIDVFLILVILFCLSVLLKIIFDKFPLLTRIKIKEISGEGQKKLKFSILEKRIFEKIKKINLKDFLKKWGEKIVKLKEKIVELEERILKEKHKKILKTKPSTIEENVESLIKDGEKFLETKNYLEAEKRFLGAASLNPINPVIFRNLAKIYLEQKKNHLAEKNLKHVLDITKHSTKWWLKFRKDEKNLPPQLVTELINSLVDLAKFYKNVGKNEKALNYFENALEFEPNNPKILDFLIDLCIILNKRDEAEQHLAKLKEINPENQKIGEWQEKIKNIAT